VILCEFWHFWPFSGSYRGLYVGLLFPVFGIFRKVNNRHASIIWLLKNCIGRTGLGS
jgi:hypothetical protein